MKMATKKASPKSAEVPVIVTTEYKGVFFGYVDKADVKKNSFTLRRARMAIYWGTTKGVMQLADTGPTGKTRISSSADMELHKVTGVAYVTPAAAKEWEARS